MADVNIRKTGRAGRITLTRPQALNAISYKMCQEIEAALDQWRDDPVVDLVIIDAAGDKAFCAGGDIQEMYDTARVGDYAYGQKFWADEYRLNLKIAAYPKPYVAFMQGFTMGGGVGISCHGSHRVVCENSQIAMPECAIGLVPDVGGSLLLARAPGFIGEYLGVSAARMQAGDAIFAGFADLFIPQQSWEKIIHDLEESGDISALSATLSDAAQPAPPSPLAALQPAIDHAFAATTMVEIAALLATANTDFSNQTLKAIGRNSPLSTSVTIGLIRMVREANTIRAALGFEYRYTYRAAEHGDFIEGIRAAIIDKDRAPNWRHASLGDVPRREIDNMLAPLGDATLKL